jgi:hypothetical protein
MGNANYKAEMLNKRLNARFKGMEEIHAYYDANLDLIAVYGATRLAGEETFYYGSEMKAYDLLTLATNDLVELKCRHLELQYQENKSLVESRKDDDAFYAGIWAKHYA